MLKAILFDHDGTLVDSESSHCAIWNSVLSEYNVELSFAEFASDCIGVPVDKTAELLIARYDLPLQAKKLADIKNSASDDFQNSQGFPAISGSMALLRELHDKGLSIAIVSGASRASVMATVAQNDLTDLVSMVVAKEDVANNKPAPDGYLQALKKMGFAADQGLAIEDSSSGISSAKAAGLTCLALHHDFIDRADLAKADAIFSDMQSLRKDLLQRL